MKLLFCYLCFSIVIATLLSRLCSIRKGCHVYRNRNKSLRQKIEMAYLLSFLLFGFIHCDHGNEEWSCARYLFCERNHNTRKMGADHSSNEKTAEICSCVARFFTTEEEIHFFLRKLGFDQSNELCPVKTSKALESYLIHLFEAKNISIFQLEHSLRIMGKFFILRKITLLQGKIPYD